MSGGLTFPLPKASADALARRRASPRRRPGGDRSFPDRLQSRVRVGPPRLPHECSEREQSRATPELALAHAGGDSQPVIGSPLVTVRDDGRLLQGPGRVPCDGEASTPATTFC